DAAIPTQMPSAMPSFILPADLPAILGPSLLLCATLYQNQTVTAVRNNHDDQSGKQPFKRSVAYSLDWRSICDDFHGRYGISVEGANFFCCCRSGALYHGWRQGLSLENTAPKSYIDWDIRWSCCIECAVLLGFFIGGQSEAFPPSRWNYGG